MCVSNIIICVSFQCFPHLCSILAFPVAYLCGFRSDCMESCAGMSWNSTNDGILQVETMFQHLVMMICLTSFVDRPCILEVPDLSTITLSQHTPPAVGTGDGKTYTRSL